MDIQKHQMDLANYAGVIKEKKAYLKTAEDRLRAAQHEVEALKGLLESAQVQYDAELALDKPVVVPVVTEEPVVPKPKPKKSDKPE